MIVRHNNDNIFLLHVLLYYYNLYHSTVRIYYRFVMPECVLEHQRPSMIVSHSSDLECRPISRMIYLVHVKTNSNTQIQLS